MKSNFLTTCLLLFLVIFTSAQTQKSDVLFTVEGTPVLASEFLRVYNKNLDLVKDESQKDVDEYLKLFINYKLKIIEARALEFDKNPQYIKELESYKRQLAENYLTDHKVTDELVKEAYERISYDIKASHILVKIAEHEKDTAAAYASILKLRNRLLNESFESVQKEVHNGNTIFAEDLGYFSGFKMVYAFENVAFNTEVGDVSQPFRTKFGYHVVKIFDKRKSRGEVTVGHIMIFNNQKDSLIKPEIRIQEIYKLIQQGENFESLAKQFSDDKSSAKNGGKLTPFKSGQLSSVAFEDLAFSLKEINDISKPFKTDYGWHIVKLYSKSPIQSFEDMKFDLELRVKRDSRSERINSSMLNILKKKYNVFDTNEELKYFESIVNDEFFKRSWTIPANLDKDKHFLKIGNKQFTYGDFANYLYNAQRKATVKRPTIDLVNDQYSTFLDTELLAYHKENLEYENQEFAEILEEYREGLLLFDLMETKIWNAVKLDTIGLQAYFNENKDKYIWQERIDAVVATSAKEKDINSVKKMLKNGVSLEDIKAKINQKDSQNVIFTSNIMNAEHRALPKDFNFKVGVSKVYFYNDAFHVVDVKRILPETEKTYNESKGRVISDYQDEVEKQWLKKLKETYKVVVNEDVLEKVKSIIKSN
ncbi:MAG: peptidylprolyl isomerase [Flavobacteriaceae bacterium]|nr:peptidylprolyl isomerase [Flavobacteriaceae bacterium]